MRLSRKNIQIQTGKVLLCDPVIVADDGTSDLSNGARFRLWQGNGEFRVYTDGESFFLDVDPLIFKVKTRTDLSMIQGKIQTATEHIGIYDLTSERLHAATDAIIGGWVVIIKDMPVGNYIAWFEEKGSAEQIFRGVIGFGSRVRMVLNGSFGEMLQLIEDRIATAYRLKGSERQAELKSIGDTLIAIHLDGCKDPRLSMLASAAKIGLPRRPRKRSGS